LVIICTVVYNILAGLFNITGSTYAESLGDDASLAR